MTYEQQTEETKKSAFNAGVAQTMRVDNEQKELNELRTSPFSFNVEYMEYNWNIFLNKLNSLYFEVRPKCTEEERKIIDKFFDGIKLLIQKDPPMKDIKGKLVFNEKAWNTINGITINYERILRDYLDKHELNSPNKEKRHRLF